MTDTVRRRRAAIASLAVAAAVAAVFGLPVPADDPVRAIVSGLGLCACGPFSGYAMSTLDLGAYLVAAALWPLYMVSIAFTRLGLVHWGVHLAGLFAWNGVGLWILILGGAGGVTREGRTR